MRRLPASTLMSAWRRSLACNYLHSFNAELRVSLREHLSILLPSSTLPVLEDGMHSVEYTKVGLALLQGTLSVLSVLGPADGPSA